MFKTAHFAKIAAIITTVYFAGCSIPGEQSKKGTNPTFILTPAEQYSTEKARRLAHRYRPNLEKLVVEIVQHPVTGQLQFANNIVAPGGIGFFTHSATRSPDDRYLEVIMSVPDVLDAKHEASAKLEQLFARYGRELLATLAADRELYAEKDVAGYGLNFSWRSSVQTPSGPRIIVERGVLYFDKEQAARFLQKQVDRPHLLAAAILFVFRDDKFVQVAYKPGQQESIAQAPFPSEAEKPRPEPKLTESLRERDLPADEPPLRAKAPDPKETPSAPRGDGSGARAPREETVSKKDKEKATDTAQTPSRGQSPEAARSLPAKPAQDLARRKQVPLVPKQEKRLSEDLRAGREPKAPTERALISKQAADASVRPERAVPSAPPPERVAPDEGQAAKVPESPPERDVATAKAGSKPAKSARQSEVDKKAETAPPEKTARSLPTQTTGSPSAGERALPEVAVTKPAEVPAAKSAAPEARPPAEPRTPPVGAQGGEPARAHASPLAGKQEDKFVPTPSARQTTLPTPPQESSKPFVEEKSVPSKVTPVQRAEAFSQPKPKSEEKPSAPVSEPRNAPGEAKPVEQPKQLPAPPAQAVPAQKSPVAKPIGPPKTDEPRVEVARARPPAEEPPSPREEKEPSQIALGKRPDAAPPKPSLRDIPKPPSEVGTPAMGPELVGFVIQLTFRQVSEAQRWREALAKEGYPSSVTAVREQELVRLRVGGFPNSAKAKELLERLKKQGLTGVVIHVPSG